MVTTTVHKDAFVLPLRNPATDAQSLFVFLGTGGRKMTPKQKRDFAAQSVNDIMGALPEGSYLEFGDVELLLQTRARYQPETEITLGSDTAVVRTGIIRYVVKPGDLHIY